MKVQSLPTREYLLETFSYNKSTGILVWRKRPRHHFKTDHWHKVWNSRYSGSMAHNMATNGYVLVNINKTKRCAHRVIWTMVKGPIPDGYEIDHRNGIRSDNRISNLRLATRCQNRANSALARPNRTGFRGVHKNGSKFRAVVWYDGGCRVIGQFATPELAHAARNKEAARLHGKFAKNT